jgi:hypothetical protein
MNLGLLDILTAQAVDKPDLKRREHNSSEPAPVAESEKIFKKYLEDEPEVKSLSQDKKTPKNNSTISENLVDNNDKGSDFNLNLNYIDINNLPEGLNKNDLLKILGDIPNQQIIGDGFATVQQGDLENQINNTLNSLISLQEVGEETSQTVPVVDILKNFKQAVSSVSNEIAQAGLQTAPKLIDETLQGASQSETSVNAVAVDLLNPQANIQQISELGILDNLAILDKGGVTKIADGVIELAKNEAETPTLIQGDVKSAQVESLLDNNKQSEGSNKQDNIANSHVSTAKHASESAEAQALTEKLQARTDNQTTAINKAENALASAQNVLSQNGSSNKDSGSNQFQNDSDLFSQTSLNKQGDIALNGDFTKFQKYMDTVSNNIKDMGALKAVKADDVLAQIKFGLSATGIKGDNKISIQLRPKELGNVDVRIEMGHDGKTKIAIMAEKTDTLNLLQKESGSLRGMLQDALQTQSSDLSFSFHNQGDQKWKEIIQEAFGNSYSKDIDEDVASASKIYSSNMIATQGLDIRV